MKIIDVNPKNVMEKGFFCKMSQKKNPGYQRKLDWLEQRFAEGLRIKMLDLSEGGRGFIEYVPGEYAWRAVEAKGYLFIHCLWVVGKSKGKGYSTRLLEQCISDAKSQGMKGVAMMTSEGNWLLARKLLLRRGFESVDLAPPEFELLVRRFGRSKLPSFSTDWNKRASRFGKGLTVVRSDQCPYLDDAVEMALETARERRLNSKVVELKTAEQVRKRAPTAYGVFGILLDGKLLSHHYLLKKDLARLLDGCEGS